MKASTQKFFIATVSCGGDVFGPRSLFASSLEEAIDIMSSDPRHLPHYQVSVREEPGEMAARYGRHSDDGRGVQVHPKSVR